MSANLDKSSVATLLLKMDTSLLDVKKEFLTELNKQGLIIHIHVEVQDQKM